MFAPMCVHQRGTPTARLCCCRWGWGAPWRAAVAQRPALIRHQRRKGGREGGRGERWRRSGAEEDLGWWWSLTRAWCEPSINKKMKHLFDPVWTRPTWLFLLTVSAPCRPPPPLVFAKSSVDPSRLYPMIGDKEIPLLQRRFPNNWIMYLFNSLWAAYWLWTDWVTRGICGKSDKRRRPN